jgi:hypothetical protein
MECRALIQNTVKSNRFLFLFRKDEDELKDEHGSLEELDIESRELTPDQLILLKSGRADTTTPVKVSVTVYTSPSFR